MPVNLLEFDPPHLAEHLAGMGEKPFRARQLLRWVHQLGVDDFGAMTDIAKDLRTRLAAEAEVRPPAVLKDTTAADGTRKWLLDVGTGNAVESVFIPDGEPAAFAHVASRGVATAPVGDDADSEAAPRRAKRYRGTLCVSSQAGCALECAFCSTGRQGFNRNLTVGEIIGQLWWANRALGRGVTAERPITNVVMMGMGEPLANYDNVVAAMRLMLDDFAYGLSRRRVTLSTSGIVPMMDRLRAELPVALAVSLHAPNDALRDELVPINRKWPLAELLAACRRYVTDGPRDFITFEYVMLDGVNDTLGHARELARLLEPVPCKLNLIPFNPFPGSGYRRSPAPAVARFQKYLLEAGYTATVRRTRGDDIDAACGQLAGQVQDRKRRRLRREPAAA